MLTDNEISQICMHRVRQADTFTSKLQDEREKSIQYYNCEPFGDEKDGESTFITSDVRDTIEWMMPQIIEMFTGEDAPVEFCARDAQDVPSAKTETEYVRHVYNQQNPGFLNTYEWIKDGLLLKNGIIKSFWDEKVDEVEETYEGKDYIEYQKLLSDPQIDIKEVSVLIDDEEFALDEVTPELIQFAKFNINCTRTEDNSQVRIKVIPPENFFVESGHNSLDLRTALFCCHRDTVTESDLIIDGYPPELVKSIPEGDDSDFDEEKTARFDDEGSLAGDGFEDNGTREITIHECYIRADFEGNGKTELRMVKLAGTSGAIVLENEIVDSIPFDCWTPVINCHKFYGMSYADMVMDLQKLRSTLMRQMLNNLYMVNHPAKMVLDNQIYKEDLYYTGPGAIWRVKSLGAIETHTTPFVGEATLPVMSLVEEMRQERTGVSPASQGLDPSVLADSTNLVGPMIMSQALMRIKMVARIFAETGFKSLMLRIHEICSKHDKARVFPVGPDYIQVNPREWSRRTQYRVKVGVGHVDKMQRISAISAILQNQTLIVQSGGMEGPLLASSNVYEALVEQAKLLGYQDGMKFYRNPAEYVAPEKEEDVMSEVIQIEEAKAVADVQKAAATNAIELKKHDDEMALKREKMERDFVLAREQMQIDEHLRKEEMLFKYGGA